MAYALTGAVLSAAFACVGAFQLSPCCRNELRPGCTSAYAQGYTHFLRGGIHPAQASSSRVRLPQWRAMAGSNTEDTQYTEKLARAEALIQKATSAPRQRRGGERRAAEQIVGDVTASVTASGGIFRGRVVAVTGNFNKTRPQVDERVKAHDAVFSGTVSVNYVPFSCRRDEF